MFGGMGRRFGRMGEVPKTGPELVVNGGFDADTDWTKGTGWTIAAGVASFTATGSTSNLSQDVGLVAGTVYSVAVTVTVSAGGVAVYAGTGSSPLLIFSAGTFTARIVATTSTLFIQAGLTFTGTIDNVSVRGP